MASFIINDIKIAGLTSSVPEVVTNVSIENLSLIQVRRSPFGQTTADLAYDAALRILEQKQINKEEIGFLLFVSRTPDYRSPNTAAILQGRLGLSLDCICYDINKGINGFISGLVTGSSILNTINKPYGLVLLGDTTSKLNLDNNDFYSIESDAASAILLEKALGEGYCIKAKMESYGNNFKNYAIPKGGFRLFHPLIPFDATNKENFNLVFDKKGIQDFLALNYPTFIRECLSDTESNAYALQHADLIFLGFAGRDFDRDLEKSSLENYGKTAGSNLPLQLDLLSQSVEKNKQLSITCNSFGEGLELSFVSFAINSSDIFPTKVFTGNFSDFRISHEI